MDFFDADKKMNLALTDSAMDLINFFVQFFTISFAILFGLIILLILVTIFK